MTEPAAPEVGALDHRSDRGLAGDVVSPAPVGGPGVTAGGFAIPGLARAVRREDDSSRRTPNSDPAENFELMYRGEADETGIGVLYVRGWSELSTDEQHQVLFWAKESDQLYGARVTGARRAVSKADRAAGNRVAAAGRRGLRLDDSMASGHASDMAGGAAFDAPQIGLPKRVNSSIGGQWKRYKKGFNFAGISIVDADTQKWIYDSGALYDAPPPVTSIKGYDAPPKTVAPGSRAPEGVATGEPPSGAAKRTPGSAVTMAQRGAGASTPSGNLQHAAGGLSAGELGALAESARGDLPSGADRTMHLVGRGIAIGSALVGAVTAVTSTLEHMAAAERVLAGGTAILGKEVDEAAQVETRAAKSQAAFGDFDREVARMCGPGGEVWAASSKPDEAAAVSAQLEDLMRNVTSAIETQGALQARLDAAIVEATAKQKAAELLTDDVAARTAMALAADGSEADRVTAMQAYEAWTRMRGSFTQARRDTEKSLEILGRARDTLTPWTESLTRAAVRGGAAWQVPGTGLVVRAGASAAGPKR